MEFDSRLDSVGIARGYDDNAEALDDLCEAIEAIDVFDICAMAAMNRAIAEYYRTCGKDAPAYTKTFFEGNAEDSAYQLFSVDFLKWLLEKAEAYRLERFQA